MGKNQPAAPSDPRWLIRAGEAERRRAAQDLHDALNQLAAVRLSLDEVEDETEGGREEIDQTRSLVDGAIEQIRRISHDLRPTALENLGLPEAARVLCATLGSRAGLAVECAWDAPLDALPDEAARDLYRMLQELLLNVEQHAGARQVRVACACQEGRLRMSVGDDGRGFAAERTEVESGKTGLNGIRERARLLGGRLTVRSTPGQGTEALVDLPLARG
jgi:two-component system NarL family sensor kinase